MRKPKAIIRTTDYYNEFQEAVLVGSSGKVMPLKTGQKVIVTWKNRRKTKEKVHVNSGRGSAQVDMNNYPDTFPTQTIFAVQNYNGTEVTIPLLGLTIEEVP